MPVIVTPLVPSDRSEWEVLAHGYSAFYQTVRSPEDYELAWSRLVAQDGVRGLVAKADGRLVGLAHFLFHTSTWTQTVCYLQDLYTAPGARGNGVARAHIDAVAEQARVEGATRFYWLTRENNAVARVLYEQVAKYGGFIRYEYPIATEA